MINKENIDLNLINYDSGLKHFSENALLYEKYIFKFLNDTHLYDAEQAFTNNDLDALLETVHALKGIAGTLSFTNLFNICSLVVQEIRNNEINKIPDSFIELRNSYNSIYSYISKLQKNIH